MSSCDKEKNNERDRQKLEQMLAEIKTLAASSVCDGKGTYELKFIKYGTRSCSGVGFLPYSTSINVSNFEKLVKEYNDFEKSYLTKSGITIDCAALILPPKSVTCENGKPVLSP